MDVGEVKKLDAYLKRLFGNARIHVVPTKGDAADVFVGAERVAQAMLIAAVNGLAMHRRLRHIRGPQAMRRP